MLVVSAENSHTCNSDQNKEVSSHQQVVSNGSGRGQFANAELRCHSSKVNAAADVGTGHHSSNTGQTLGITKGAVQQSITQESTGYSTNCTDEEDCQHTAGLRPDLLQVALQQQQRNTDGNHDTPNYVVVQITAGGDNTQVCQNHSHDQSNNCAGNFGSPIILLLQPDGESNTQTHNSQQSDRVIRSDQSVTQQFFKQCHIVFPPIML